MPTHTNQQPAEVITADHIRADGISHRYGDRPVFTDLTLIVDGHQRIGLIGENGVGKSTLLRIIAGEETPDVGTITRPHRTSLLWQEVQFRPDDTITALIEAAISDLRAVEHELEDAALELSASGGGGERYARALERAESAELWSIDSRRDELLAGLGVGDIPTTRRLDEISGGQRSRFALAALLLAGPTALLLDEPTNHLDDDAADFLRRQLIRWQGPVVFASHDRAFLDEVATDIVDIDPSRGGVRRFGGNRPATSGGIYTDYLADKAAERARWEAQFADEQHELKSLRFSVDVISRDIAPNRGPRDNDKMAYDFKAGTVARQVSRRVRNAQVRLDDLTENQVRKPPALLRFSGIPHGSHAAADGGLVMHLSGGSIRGRLDDATLQIEPTTSLLVTGRNGAGKSSLLGALAGTLALESGSVQRRKGLRVALLEQDVRFTDASKSPRQLYEAAIGSSRAEALPLAGLGLISPRDLDRPAGRLSIGQQRRLALALIIARPPHVFLLDEPTNHLSLGLATELEEALDGYPGAVIVASHDRWLRRRWSGDLLRMEDGRIGAQIHRQ